MTRGWLRWAPMVMATVAGLPVLLGILAFRGTPTAPGLAEAGTGRSGVENTGQQRSTLDTALSAALHAAPFRPNGRPSAIPYDPSRADQFQQIDAPARPTFVVDGVIGGTAPAVVLEGIPGREGAVLLAVGDTAGGVRVRRIKGNEVTLSGMDTTWVLTVRRLQ